MNVIKLILLIMLIFKSKHCLTDGDGGGGGGGGDDEEEKDVSEQVINFLIWNNYLNNNSSNFTTIDINNENVKEALINMQEFYHIEDDGKLNAQTLELIRKPRCGVPDILTTNNFMLGPAKWYKDEISWHFIHAGGIQFQLTKNAFDTWQNHSFYTFRYEPIANRADIVISFKSLQHNFSRCCKRQPCQYDFDGEGTILAHAYYPYKQYSHVEIHLDKDEKWEYSDVGMFYQTILHEIGHSLGLEHTSVKGSVMYSYFQQRNTTDLAKDDIFAIQERYRYPKKITPSIATTTTSTTPKSKITTTTTTSVTQKSTTTKKTNIGISSMLKPDDSKICDYQKELRTFLFANGKFYIFHKNLVWMKEIQDSILHDPESITNWLGFIPKNITSFEIGAIYQQSNSEVVLMLNDMVYVIMIPSLKLSHTPVNIRSFYIDLPQDAHVNTVFNSYLEYVYIIYNNIHLGKIDRCSRRFEYLGLVSDYFLGVPATVDGVYRYIDGHLYFLANEFIYVYNEFTKTIKEVKPRNVKAFDIECPNKPLLEQLQLLLNQILFRKIIV
jgi:hypothetical protein